MLRFASLFGTRALLKDSDYCYKNIHFIRAYIARGRKLHKIPLSQVIAYNSDDKIEAVKLLLKAGVNPQITEDRFNYPLLEAARIGSKECAQLLLSSGADPNAHKECGRAGISEWTPLVMACRHGHLEIVEQLLAAGADVNITGKYYEVNALYTAVVNNHRTVAELLISRGININPKDCMGRGPLEACIREGAIEMVQVLLEAGCDPNPSVLTGKGTCLLKDCLNLVCPEDKYAAIKNLLDK